MKEIYFYKKRDALSKGKSFTLKREETLYSKKGRNAFSKGNKCILKRKDIYSQKERDL